MAAASARAASAAAAAAAAQSKPPPPPSPVQVTAPRQSLLRRRPDETAVSAPKPAPLSNHPPPLAAQPLTGVNFTPLGRETPLLMICYKRADYLRRSLAAVKRFHPTRGAVPVVISQDGSQARVRSVVEEFQRAMARDDPDAIVVHLRHEQSQNPGKRLPQARSTTGGPSSRSSPPCRRMRQLSDRPTKPSVSSYSRRTLKLLQTSLTTSRLQHLF